MIVLAFTSPPFTGIFFAALRMQLTRHGKRHPAFVLYSPLPAPLSSISLCCAAAVCRAEQMSAAGKGRWNSPLDYPGVTCPRRATASSRAVLICLHMMDGSSLSTIFTAITSHLLPQPSRHMSASSGFPPSSPRTALPKRFKTARHFAPSPSSSPRPCLRASPRGKQLVAGPASLQDGSMDQPFTLHGVSPVQRRQIDRGRFRRQLSRLRSDPLQFAVMLPTSQRPPHGPLFRPVAVSMSLDSSCTAASVCARVPSPRRSWRGSNQ